MNDKPKLLPMKVPWQISPSVSDLQLRVSETAGAISILANVNFFHDDKADTKRLELSFNRSLHARFSPSWSDSEVIREDDFDWALVPAIDPSSIEESQRDFFSAWSTSGVCPDCGMYQILDSPWGDEIKGERALRHYLVTGHDGFIEVLADNFEWNIVQNSG